MNKLKVKIYYPIYRMIGNIKRNFPMYSQKKLLLSFEYGAVMSDVAKKLDRELDRKTITRMENIIVKEFAKKSPTRLAVDMTVNILAGFETN